MKPLKIAALVSVFYPASHADVILSRWNILRPDDREWGLLTGRTRITSLHVAQHPENDISGAYCREQGVKNCVSIEEALCLDESVIAVDGVLIIYEHGDYSTDSRGVKRYPRKDIFDQVIACFRRCGRTVPVFCDKHLSWNAEWAMEMVVTARNMGFGLFAGSTTPWVHWNSPPDPEIVHQARHALSIFYGGLEVYGVHGMEGALSLLEKRLGGESGVAEVRALSGPEAFGILENDEVDRELFRQALAAAGGGGNAWKEEQDLVLIELVHRDGLRNQFVYLGGLVAGFSVAVKAADGRIWAGRYQMGDRENHYAHFAALNVQIERHFLNEDPPRTIERTLLATVAMAAAMDDLHSVDDSNAGDILPQLPGSQPSDAQDFKSGGVS